MIRYCAAARRGEPRQPFWLGCAVLLCTALLGCVTISSPQQGRRSFMGDVPAQRETRAEGLNPLAMLPRCQDQLEAPTQGIRVLTEDPTFLSKVSSAMLILLWQSLQEAQREDDVLVALVQLERELSSAADARSWAQRCGASMVLWEPEHHTQLSLNRAAAVPIPLRELPREHLCRYGEVFQRLGILYHTIVGAAQLSARAYDQALLHFRQARTIDAQCFKWPFPSRLITDRGPVFPLPPQE